jgi:P pilus assembly chaperone PapD
VRTGGSLPEDRESVFWLNVKSIPATDDSVPHNNVLQVVVKSRLKLFYRPAGLEGSRRPLTTTCPSPAAAIVLLSATPRLTTSRYSP